MATVRQIAEQEAKETINQIQDTLSSKGINNTGQTSNSLRYETQETAKDVTVTIYADDVLEVLNTGRGPGKFPPPDNIEDWVSSKLDSLEEGTTASQVAYLVGRKISKEGTEIYKDNSKGIELSKKVDDLNQRLRTKLPQAVKFEVEQELNKFIKAKFGQNN